MTTPHGAITTSYGAFGTSSLGFNLGYGGQNWGNFISASGMNSGRFLDPPEFIVKHDKGNEENFFDRLDYQLSMADSLHLNLGFSRSWFQTPNSFDNLNTGITEGDLLGTRDPTLIGPTDQRSDGSAVSDSNIQCRAHVEPAAGPERRAHRWRVRAP